MAFEFKNSFRNMLALQRLKNPAVGQEADCWG